MHQGEKTALWLLLFWIAVVAVFWGVAFYPVTSPNWVGWIQSVCFQMDSGKPNAGGWIQLIATPLTMLAALVFLTFQDLRKALFKLWRSHLGKGLYLIIAVALSIETMWVLQKYSEQKPLALSISQSTPMVNKVAYDFTLVNQAGKPITLSQLTGHPVLIVFAYSHCKAICTQIIENLKTIQHGKIPKDTHILLITLDPWRDTPERLATIAKEWDLADQTITLLSGPPAVVTDILSHYNVVFGRDPKTGEISHKSQWVIVDPKGKIRYEFTSMDPEGIQEGLRIVARSRHATLY